MKKFFSSLPLVGGLGGVNAAAHWQATRQTTANLVLSSFPIWLGTIVGLLMGTDKPFMGTIGSGELFIYSTAFLGPVLWMAMSDPPGADQFPSKLSHGLLVIIICAVAAVAFGLRSSPMALDMTFLFRLSIVTVSVAVGLLYLATVYHERRMPYLPTEFREQEKEFTGDYRKHRGDS